jgi:hypothetical protein
MRAVLLVLSVIGSSLVPAPSVAQDSDYSTKETRVLMHAYAKCVVERQPRRASEALLENVDNGTMLRRYSQLIIGDCLVRQTRDSAQMRFSGDLYRYALADALVNRELATSEIADLSNIPRLAQRDFGEPPSPIGTRGKKISDRKYEAALEDHRENFAIAYIARFGECVVRLAPGEAKALLLTPPDSNAETAHLAALRPALGTCLPEGQTLKFGRTTLRGTIAVNYYRLMKAAQEAAIGPAT